MGLVESCLLVLAGSYSYVKVSRFGRDPKAEDQISEALSRGTFVSIEGNFKIKRRIQERLREPMAWIQCSA